MSETYSISELAREFGITTRTIRFYEDRQLIHPAREGTRRIYSRRDRTRLKLVLRGRRLGWPLDDLRDMISMYDAPGGEHRQLELMIEKLQQNRSILLKQQEDIRQSLAELDELERNCREKMDSLHTGGGAHHETH